MTMIKGVTLNAKKEKNIISLTRIALVEDVLFNLKPRKGDILNFENGKKELIERVERYKIIVYRLEKEEVEGVAEMVYRETGDFNVEPNHWYSKQNYPKLYQKIKKGLEKIK